MVKIQFGRLATGALTVGFWTGAILLFAVGIPLAFSGEQERERDEMKECLHDASCDYDRLGKVHALSDDATEAFISFFVGALLAGLGGVGYYLVYRWNELD